MALAKLEIDTGGEPLLRRWKSIKLDGHEIIGFVQGITVRAHVGELSTAVIELAVKPEFANALVAPVDTAEEEG